MAKKYKLAIADIVSVPMKVRIVDADGKDQEYKFTLECKRQGTDSSMKQFKDLSTYDVMMSNVIGWSGQRLVLDEDGNPAEFCEEALKALFDIQGLLIVCFNAYVNAQQAVAKT